MIYILHSVVVTRGLYGELQNMNDETQTVWITRRVQDHKVK